MPRSDADIGSRDPIALPHSGFAAILDAGGRTSTVARVFVSQEVIDQWSSDERIALDGDVMVLTLTQQRMRLVPAVRVLRVVSGTNDAHNLVGRVKTRAELQTVGGEEYMSSLVVGEIAYDVQPGYCCDPLDDSPVALRQLQSALQSLAQS
jgi:hypothetical protein